MRRSTILVLTFLIATSARAQQAQPDDPLLRNLQADVQANLALRAAIERGDEHIIDSIQKLSQAYRNVKQQRDDLVKELNDLKAKAASENKDAKP